MTTLRDLFIEEAAQSITAMRGQLSGPSPDAMALHRAVRRVRGGALMARFGSVAREVLIFERELRDWVESDAPMDVGRIHRTWAMVDELKRQLERVRAGTIRPDIPTGVGMDEQGTQAREEVIDVELLEYRGDRALERAEELRQPLEDALASGDSVWGMVDELFDLIRLARS